MSEQRSFDPAQVPIRPAATVMLVRDIDGEAGVEVFMLRRTLAAAFGSGMYVFPGGRVETADGADVEAAHGRHRCRRPPGAGGTQWRVRRLTRPGGVVY